MATAPPPPSSLEAIAIEACRLASAQIRSSRSTSPLRSKSTASDVVTATDLAAEEIIRTYLEAATPGARVLAEEAGSGVLGDGPHGAIEWVIDPLDGTVNFTYGVPITAASIAAVVDGVLSAGAVVDNASGECFSAHLDGGARLDGQPIGCRPAESLAMCLVATGFSYTAALRQSHGRVVAELLGHVRDVRGFGSAALHWCWVACGRVDAYVERDTKPWDYAGGALIAREAGARIELPCPENGGLSLAAHPARFAELRALV